MSKDDSVVIQVNMTQSQMFALVRDLLEQLEQDLSYPQFYLVCNRLEANLSETNKTNTDVKKLLENYKVG